VSSLPQGLQELGYVEGRDLEIVYRYVDGDYTRLPAVVDELNKLKPQVVVSAPASGVLAVNQAAPTIPIVGSALIDPVGFGLAASLARPGGQVTGILYTLDTLPGKQLELMLQVMPGVKRIGLLVNINVPTRKVFWRNAETAAAALAVELVPVEVRRLPKVGGRARRVRAGAAGRDVPDRARRWRWQRGCRPCSAAASPSWSGA
jgi:putative tryptophan/tyrosine transport system substrate-binding protein